MSVTLDFIRNEIEKQIMFLKLHDFLKVSTLSYILPEERVKKILSLLEKAYPDAGLVLHYKNPLELLVATILAAQCMDERVNKVTETLFKKYTSAKDYANTKQEIFEQEIRSMRRERWSNLYRPSENAELQKFRCC